MRINPGFNQNEDDDSSTHNLIINGLENYHDLIGEMNDEEQTEIREISQRLAQGLAIREQEISVAATELPKHILPGGQPPSKDEIKSIAQLELLSYLAWTISNSHRAIAALLQQIDK